MKKRSRSKLRKLVPDQNKLQYIDEHLPHLGTAYFVSFNEINSGDVISFTYKGKEPGDVKEVRWVFVLDPNYKGKLHGLTLGLTPRKVVVNDVVGAMFKTDQPYDMYYHDIQRVAKKWDSYRTYFVRGIEKPRRMPYYLTDKPVFKDGERIK